MFYNNNQKNKKFRDNFKKFSNLIYIDKSWYKVRYKYIFYKNSKSDDWLLKL